MRWQALCDRPDLRNLPFKIELNERDQVIMSPVKVYHAALQGEIAALLRQHRPDGKILTECAIQTRRGTKVADVSWAARETYARVRHEDECSIAPEVCIEVLSNSNTRGEIEEKKALYFERGAQEVWLCDPRGAIQYFAPDRRLERSALFPRFPARIDLDDA